MSEEQNNNQFSPDDVERIIRQSSIALKVAKEAVLSAKIPPFPASDEFTNFRWRISYKEDREITLVIEVDDIFTTAVVQCSLLKVSWVILREMELLLSNPKAMKYFAIKEANRESEIFSRSLQITQDYIHHLQFVIYHSFPQTLNESIITYIKKFVDYDMREWFEEEGKPQKNFTLLPNDNLNDITKLFPDVKFQLLNVLEQVNEEFSVYRKGVFSDKKIWLKNPEAFLKLPSEYEQLKLQFKNAKKQHKIEREAFHRVNRRATVDDWQRYWREVYDEKFPNTSQADEITNYSASQLAYRHLADTFGFSAVYMEKIVRNARAQLKAKAQKVNQNG